MLHPRHVDILNVPSLIEGDVHVLHHPRQVIRAVGPAGHKLEQFLWNCGRGGRGREGTSDEVMIECCTKPDSTKPCREDAKDVLEYHSYTTLTLRTLTLHSPIWRPNSFDSPFAPLAPLVMSSDCWRSCAVRDPVDDPAFDPAFAFPFAVTGICERRNDASHLQCKGSRGKSPTLSLSLFLFQTHSPIRPSSPSPIPSPHPPLSLFSTETRTSLDTMGSMSATDRRQKSKRRSDMNPRSMSLTCSGTLPGYQRVSDRGAGGGEGCE